MPIFHTGPRPRSGSRELDWTSQIGLIDLVAIITNTAAMAACRPCSLAALIAGTAIALALTLLVEALRTPRHAHIRHQCQLRKPYRDRALS